MIGTARAGGGGEGRAEEEKEEEEGTSGGGEELCFHLSSPGRTGAAGAGPGRGQHAPPPGSGPDTRGERESGGGGGGGRMQGKKPGGSSGGGRSGELQGDEAQRNKKKKKKASCFSNIKIFLVSECALMLAQGTVGAYLVSPCANSAAGPLPQPGARVAGGPARGGGRAGVTSAGRGG